MTTLTTVGYGDITISNGLERVFCIFLMFFGLVWFAAIPGPIFAMLHELDEKDAVL